jgi:dynein assembly factor 3
LFLEVFGSLNITEKTNNFILSESKVIQNTLFNESKNALQKTINLTNLKYRECDDIDFVLKFWLKSDSLDAQKQHDQRLRNLLQQRFDQKENIIDWDYNMKLLKTNAILATKREYLAWRLTGDCFKMRDQKYSHQNRTLQTVDVVKRQGMNQKIWGLFHDIFTGPFIAFGTTSEFKTEFKKQNDHYSQDCTGLSYMNVEALIHEFQTGNIYEGVNLVLEEVGAEYDVTDHVEFVFLPCDPKETFEKQHNKYKHFFDVVYLGNVLSHRLKESAELINQSGRIVVEGVNYLLELKEEHVIAYNAKVQDIATEIGLTNTFPKEKKPDFLTFNL